VTRACHEMHRIRIERKGDGKGMGGNKEEKWWERKRVRKEGNKERSRIGERATGMREGEVRRGWKRERKEGADEEVTEGGVGDGGKGKKRRGG